ncbi:MAG: hypothetical protein H6Q86_4880, partial [candidate division NC10 bacterium]|nr:hypothetical protein [candidate division NC10 bacterium]
MCRNMWRGVCITVGLIGILALVAGVGYAGSAKTT